MPKLQAQPSRARVHFIFVTILLDAIGLGLLIPVMPDVLRRFNTDPAFVASHYGWFLGVYAIMQFVASPVLGSLSDRYGRRGILLVSLLVAGVDYLFMAFAPTLTLLYLGRALSGLTGASQTVASSYMADISTDKDRGANFGMIGAAFGVGFILGPMLGGLVAGFSSKAPFLIAAVLNLLNFGWGLFVLPESLDAAHRRQVELKKLNPFRSIARILKPSPISTLVLVFFILFLAGQVHPVNWTIYTEDKFGWTAQQVGYSLAFVGGCIAFSNAVLTRVLIPKLGEDRALHLGLWIYALGFVGFGLAPYGWVTMVVMVPFSVAGIAMPALQSIVTKHVPKNEQGELQGSLVSLGALACVIAPILFTKLYTHFAHPTDGSAPFHGAAYVGAGVICLGAIGLDMVRDKADTHMVHVADPDKGKAPKRRPAAKKAAPAQRTRRARA
jgi:DHA1 family tetracycline resistance protein-like MFS transporter